MNAITRRATLAGAAALACSTARAAPARMLEFTSWQSEEPGFSTWWKEVIAAFNASGPAAGVAMTAIPFGSYVDQLTIRFASNRPPPLLHLPTDSFGAFASQDWLAPLDARIKGTAIATDWPALQGDLVWDGKTQGVLLMGYGFMLCYNAALLDAAGMAVPSSWEGFAASLPKLTQRDRGQFALAAVTAEYPTIVQDFIRNIVWSGGTLLKDKNYALTDPAVTAAVERYRQIVGGNAPIGQNSTVARQLFVDGKTAFLIDGPWVGSLFDKAPASVRPALKMIGAPFAPRLGGASNSIHIAAGLDSATADAAWAFVSFLTQPRWQQRYTELSSAPAPLKGALTAQLAAERPDLAAINAAADGARSTTPPNQALRSGYNEFIHIMQGAAMRVISSPAPVATILADTQAQLERAVPLS